MFELKPFETGDLDTVKRIESAIFPEYQSGSVKWRAGQRLDDLSKASGKYVAIETDHSRVVGYGSISLCYSPASCQKQLYLGASRV